MQALTQSARPWLFLALVLTAAPALAQDDTFDIRFEHGEWYDGRIFITVEATNITRQVLPECMCEFSISENRNADIRGNSRVRFGTILPGETVVTMFEVRDKRMNGFDFEAEMSWNPDGEPQTVADIPRWLEDDIEEVQDRIDRHNALRLNTDDEQAVADYDMEAAAINLDRDRVNRLVDQFENGVREGSSSGGKKPQSSGRGGRGSRSTPIDS